MKLILSLYLTVSACLLLAGNLRGQPGLASIEGAPGTRIESTQKTVEVSLEEALKVTADYYEVFFNYYPDIIRPYTTALPEVKRMTLEQTLARMLRNTNLGFQYTGERQLVIATKSDINKLPAYLQVDDSPVTDYVSSATTKPNATDRKSGTAKLQPEIRTITVPVATVSGRVTDDEGIPMIGVSVQLKDNLGTGTATDFDGNYSLALPSLAVSLVFSYTGYETQTVAVGNREVVDVTLAAASELLDEVVVIGYGTRSARDLTGAVSAVDAKAIEKSPNISPEAAIQGRLPGVYISTPGGNPGARPEVQIRGVGTFGNAEPLYVIDGVPITEFGTGASSNSRAGDLRGNINILSFINPADIESVSVLKDASAAAIYGVRAANGVILITTKRGQNGAPRVSIDASYGVQEAVNTYDVLNVDQYVDLYTDAYNNDPNEELPGIFDPTSPSYLGNRPTTDWQEELKNNNSTVQNYGLRISGGNASTTYYLSGGYSYQESPLRENDLKRYSFAGNFDSEISRYVRVGANYRIGYVDANDNTRGNVDLLGTAPPWQPVYDGDGNPAVVQSVTFTPNEMFDPNNPTTGAAFNLSSDSLLYGPETSNNPIGLQQETDVTYGLLRNLGSAFLELEPLVGLKFRGTLSADFYTNRQLQFIGFDRYLYSQVPRNPYTGNDGTSAGSFSESTSRNFNLVKEFSINYAREFNGHSFDLLLNAMDQRYTFESTTVGTGQLILTDENLRVINGANAFTGAAGQREANALQGYMARLGYNFDSRYYLDLTVRRDGSSRFSPDFRWGTFPSVAAAWRISSEPFMENINFFSDLKLRAGWGQLGNQETSSFAFLSTISFTPDYAFGSGNGNPIGSLLYGARLPDLPNARLGWETAETFNIGIDAYALRDKLTFTVEYYDRTTKGIIQSTQLAPSLAMRSTPS